MKPRSSFFEQERDEDEFTKRRVYPESSEFDNISEKEGKDVDISTIYKKDAKLNLKLKFTNGSVRGSENEIHSVLSNPLTLTSRLASIKNESPRINVQSKEATE